MDTSGQADDPGCGYDGATHFPVCDDVRNGVDGGIEGIQRHHIDQNARIVISLALVQDHQHRAAEGQVDQQQDIRADAGAPPLA